MTRHVWLALFLWSFACREPDQRQPEAAPPAQAPAREPPRVHISREAREHAGIRVGVPERRVLFGGTAVPAEVQFDPSSTAHVSPLVPGRVTQVTVQLGERVRRGQLLGVLASTDVSAARARLSQAQARLAAAEATLRRQRQLSEEGIGARRALVEAEAEVGQLRAEVDGLRRQLSVFGSGKAGDLALTSPIDGVLVGVHATLGETASPDQPAFVVTDPTRVWVRGHVPELEIARLELGAAVVVRLHAFPELEMPGVISYIAPALDESTRALPIRVTLTQPDPRLRSGLFGTIELLGAAPDERVLTVPEAALATVDGDSVVFVASEDGETFRPRPVVLGRRARGFVEVRAGLSDDVPIALSGAFTLKSVLRESEFAGGN